MNSEWGRIPNTNSKSQAQVIHIPGIPKLALPSTRPTRPGQIPLGHSRVPFTANRSRNKHRKSMFIIPEVQKKKNVIQSTDTQMHLAIAIVATAPTTTQTAAVHVFFLSRSVRLAHHHPSFPLPVSRQPHPHHGSVAVDVD